MRRRHSHLPTPFPGGEGTLPPHTPPPSALPRARHDSSPTVDTPLVPRNQLCPGEYPRKEISRWEILFAVQASGHCARTTRAPSSSLTSSVTHDDAIFVTLATTERRSWCRRSSRWKWDRPTQPVSKINYLYKLQNTKTNNLLVYGSPEAGLSNNTFVQSENSINKSK